ncbi:hypothetical protein D9V30_10400 [Mycetocola reblochoni]|uniref:DNA-binding protein n=1 Tax=Mycetocola reblochoni TaxID=331618 RepID=A0A3L6ZLJ2_9MICO|nr:hypothetical protein [Mycetocola reblochoni]RLP68391.1 hypothetical protein D9V30_10400 [Mycetocola reblochoni]
MNDRLPPFSSPKTLAAYLEVPVSTLGNWRTTGVGPVYSKMSNLVRYADTDVYAWLESTKQNRTLR